jgi:UDP-N-acetylmuramyl pentapeptide phosphotransferase/UDP-N-acetylglucosamine-1-phosphate transferase
MLTTANIQRIIGNLLSAQMLTPSIVTFMICFAFVLLTPTILKLIARREDLHAVQSAHTLPTLRFGGLGILAGVLTGMLILSPDAAHLSYAVPLLVSAVPLFLAGSAEDLGFLVTPKLRIGAIAISALCCAVFLPAVVTQLGLPLVDDLLAIYPAALLFTIFAASGVTNAFNLIDGLNGLASFTAITTAVALCALALIGGLGHLITFYALLAAVTFGFFILNYPAGKLFLGDGGAYLLGHCLVWGGITLANELLGVSAFAILLIFFWPIADTALAIWRRVWRSTPTAQPDRLHFHQLAMRFLEIRVLGRNRRRLANPLATLLIAPLIVTPQICGVLFAFEHASAMIATGVFTVIFFATYLTGMRVAKRGRVSKNYRVGSQAGRVDTQ